MPTKLVHNSFYFEMCNRKNDSVAAASVFRDDELSSVIRLGIGGTRHSYLVNAYGPLWKRSGKYLERFFHLPTR